MSVVSVATMQETAIGTAIDMDPGWCDAMQDLLYYLIMMPLIFHLGIVIARVFNL